MKKIKCEHLIAIAFLPIAVGCEPGRLSHDPITICDNHGCAERPSNYQTFDPNASVPNDDPEGRMAALEQLAIQDSRGAYDLGLRLFRGDGVRQNSYRAIKMMRDAAERGLLEAQKAVGRLYLTGLGEMGPDPNEAQRWLTVAAGRGDKEAAELLKAAEQARKDEQDYYRFKQLWQPRFYNYWYTDYHYFWGWGSNRQWYLY